MQVVLFLKEKLYKISTVQKIVIIKNEVKFDGYHP
jgi:hypothetical protein